jgi:hypothetical protein
MQGMACNGLHSIEQRACRWLLTTRDRLGSHELNITHDFLAQMLGVRRASVSECSAPCKPPASSAHRGKVTILDAEVSPPLVRMLRHHPRRIQTPAGVRRTQSDGVVSSTAGR